MKYILLFLFFCLPVFSISQTRITYVKMERTACFGKCPAYTVEFHKDGRIEYNGIKHTPRKGFYTARISAKQMAAFFRSLEKYQLRTLKSSYKPKATDLPRQHLNFTISGKSYRIRNAESGPDYLITIGKLIDQKIKGLKWTQVRFIPPAVVDEDPEEVPPLQEITESNQEIKGDPGNVVGEFEQPTDQVFTYVDQMPEFPGGMQALKDFLIKNIHYPEMAKEAGIQGKVYCKFVVDKDGYTSKHQVLRGIGHGCDQEALRVLKMMPRWTPGTNGGRTVSVYFTIPVNFVLK